MAEAVSNTRAKLETLKEAEAQVQAQFERGEVSEEQLRALQREIIATEGKLGAYERAAEDTAEAVERMGRESEGAGESQKKLRDTISEQKAELSDLKTKYADVVAAQGRNSAEARALAQQISSLSGELRENETRMAAAEQEADRLDESLDDVADSADKAEKSGGKLGETMKNVAAVGLKAAAAAAAAAATAALALAKSVITAYGDTEQLVGGVETLFGAGGKTLEEYAASVGKASGEVVDEYNKLMAAQDQVLKNADNAYKTAGLSANQYMETVTSFSASLIQSLGGDTVKAAEYADRAITDMSDNANKMGTSMGDIQNAYNGFAKQNYTMLDNLKLGYGGTQEEMKRLIAHASTLTDVQQKLGVTVDANSMSYANIVDAISVVQTEMGITGTTAAEAEKTIQGSMNAFKAALDNLRSGLGNADADLGTLAGNVTSTFKTVIDNIKPVIENLASALPEVIGAVATAAADLLPALLPAVIGIGTTLVTTLSSTLASQLPTLLSTGAQMVGQLLVGIVSALPDMIQRGMDMVGNLVAGIQTYLPVVLEKGAELLAKLGEGLRQALPGLVSQGLEIIMNFATTLYDAAPKLIETGFQLLSDLVAGIMSALPTLIEKGPEIISKFANIINDNFPTILMKGVELIGQIILGIIQAIPTLVANIPKIITAIVDVWEAFNWLDLGKKALTLLKDGIMSMVGAIKSAGTSVLEACTNSLKDLPSKLMTIGKNAITDLGSALRNGLSTVKSAATTIMNGILDTLKSIPSKVLSIGADIVRGVWDGISGMTGWIVGKVQGFASSILGGIKSALGIHSPSRVFRDEVGKMLPAGMAEGIEDEADVPIKAMAKVSQGVLGAAESMNGLTLDRQLRTTFGGPTGPAAVDGGLLAKLDKILDAIEAGKVLTIDGDQLVGATASRYDAALGRRRVLAARGAI